jgi:hypothetical protein
VLLLWLSSAAFCGGLSTDYTLRRTLQVFSTLKACVGLLLGGLLENGAVSLGN